jgi:hypothetical protein
MFKPLTLSLSLAVALGACSVSMAGLFASPQCSPQTPCASGQSCLPSAQCSLPRKHWNFHLPKPCFTYEWVLRKKLVWSCGNSGCTTCVTPSAQCGPSPQILGSGQGYPTVYGGIYGTGTMTAGAPTSPMTAAAPTGSADEAPPAPEVGGAAPTTPGIPAAPVNPDAPPAAPAVPAAPVPGPTSSLLFSTPTGN